jgi:glycosyltransferase involved in cell wall biosynthesis
MRESKIASAQAPKKRPLVSVVVPTFNRPEMLKETLASIDAQSYSPIEILVVNDGGVDIESTLASLNLKSHIVLLRHSTNRGLPAARNTGIKAASGEYIAYVDDDDIYYPDHIETLVSCLLSSGHKIAYSDAYEAQEMEGGTFLENLALVRQATLLYVLSRVTRRCGLGLLRRSLGSFGFCFGQAFLKLSASNVDPFLRAGGKYLVINRKAKYSNDFDRNTLLVRNFVPVLCLMHHRSCVDDAGLFDESLTSHEDWDLWIRMAEDHTFVHIKELTCEYSQRADGSNMSSYRRADFKRTMKIIHEKYRHLVRSMDVIEAQRAYLSSLSCAPSEGRGKSNK